ncbi:MAG: hypothetical protein WCV90_07170 [Candidatus Woesearchaeota archaeon]|jgi:hypothetical protein
MALENIIGNLRDAYKQAVPGTVLCVDQLMAERRTNPELRDNWFYTADGMVYSMDEGIPTLRITREATNPILKNIDTAFDQFMNKGNYLVPSAEFEAVKTAADTVTIDLTKLTSQGIDHEYRFLAVDTSKHLSKYNAEEQKLLERVFGVGDDYTQVMEMLRTSRLRIRQTRVYVLNPWYVTMKGANIIGRASWLYSLNGNSNFGVSDRDIRLGNFRVRGVRREVK